MSRRIAATSVAALAVLCAAVPAQAQAIVAVDSLTCVRPVTWTLSSPLAPNQISIGASMRTLTMTWGTSGVNTCVRERASVSTGSGVSVGIPAILNAGGPTSQSYGLLGTCASAVIIDGAGTVRGTVEGNQATMASPPWTREHTMTGTLCTATTVSGVDVHTKPL